MECPMCSKKLQLIKKYDMRKLNAHHHSTNSDPQLADTGFKTLFWCDTCKKELNWMEPTGRKPWWAF
ncbi:hypothetical protein DGMP_07990 [Desulfomarina profundi]|uniref:Uncharacterized protein n=1 Tax=Desulfomarina profundi TaxID=2772557 RepID=A0A8D5FGA9_9BACT|nr:hypothetical protein [Desulfomarina profundi]BCL60106.1 hypothetical protein DGMP_07990 [Desulfomarina profundi]